MARDEPRRMITATVVHINNENDATSVSVVVRSLAATAVCEINSCQRCVHTFKNEERCLDDDGTISRFRLSCLEFVETRHLACCVRSFGCRCELTCLLAEPTKQTTPGMFCFAGSTCTTKHALCQCKPVDCHYSLLEGAGCHGTHFLLLFGASLSETL